MKSLAIGLCLSILSFASFSKANSGSFCNPQGERVEYICGESPFGGGWVPQGDGCYHRNTLIRCSDGGGNGVFNPRPTPPTFPTLPTRPTPPHNPPPFIFPPSNPGHGNVVCRADDAGWEEHFSHGSCGSCLAQHDRCVETCEITSYTCDSQGFDYAGRTLRFSGSGSTRYEAERDADRNCQYNAESCQLLSCRSSDEVVSRRDCR